MTTYSIPTKSLARRRLTTTLALAAAAVLAACSSDGEANEGDTTAAPAAMVLSPQDVAVTQEGEIGTSLVLSGPLEPKEQVTLRAQVGGTVANLSVDRGSAVRRGQRLATIRAVGVQSQAAGARAQVASAQAGLAVARQRRDAAQTLREAGAMSEIDYRTALAQYEAAEAQLAAARAQAASSGEAAGFTTVESPLDGIVSDRRVEEGEAVNPGTELLTVVDTRVLELAGRIGVADAGRVRPGQAVTFELDALPGEPLRGRVARVDPTADAGTRQVGVYVELPNPTGRIVGGQFARGRIATGAAGVRGVLIPQTAVLGTPGAATGAVFVVDNGRLARREVQLGTRDEATGMVAVLSGVRAGERVIAVPSTDVKEGTPVTVSADEGGATVPATGGSRE